MAVYTRVTAPDLIEFLSHYDLGDLVSHEGIAAGVSNTNYFLTTSEGRYILTLFEPHRVNPEDIPFFIHYATTLQKAGVPCPETLLRRDGKGVSPLCNRPAAIFSILAGDGAAAGTLTPQMCEQAGAVLANMHLAARTMLETQRNHFGLLRWQNWMDKLGSTMDVIAPGLHALTANELSNIESGWPRELPQGPIHGDYFPDNVFFGDDGVTGVIDFHFVSTDLFAYDLAIAANAWSFDGANEFVPARFEALLRGYELLRPLLPAERAAMPLLLRAAALRFLLSRIEEKLNWKEGDFMKPHDPLVFEKRLRHFQVFQLPVAA